MRHPIGWIPALLLAILIITNQVIRSAPSKKAESLTAENFSLLDQDGRFHELYYYSDSKAIVIIVQGNGCPIIRQSIAYLNTLKAEYEPRGVRFFMINASPQDDRADIKKEAEAFHISYPILKDESGIIAESLNLFRTTEAVIINTADWSIAYHGAITDQWRYESRLMRPKHQYLRDALDALLAHQPVISPRIAVKGCLIRPPNSRIDKNKNITYINDVAPILVQHCVVCHSPGGVAPWSMDNYKKVAGWGPMIREVVRIKRMPPWHADSYYGEWTGDLALSPKEVKTLVHWIEQGFPRGEGEDPLPKATLPRESQWTLGQPDLVVEVKDLQRIPATGSDLFLNLEGDKMIAEDKWVRAIEVRPKNPKVVHHCNIVIDWKEHQKSTLTSDESGEDIQEKEKWYQLSGLSKESGEVIAGYSPGNCLLTLPEGTGIFIPKGSRVIFRMHYITTGKVEEDRSQVGFYFNAKRPPRICSVETINNRSIKIPAGKRDYHLAASRTFLEEVTLTAIQPHMHYRGKSMKFIAEYPDGKREVLLSVPQYKFHWQRRYELKSPKTIPAGTRMVVDGYYDNSAQNPDNPDATREVHFGPGSQDEMFTGILFYIKSDIP